MKIILRILFNFLFRVKVFGIKNLDFNGPTILMPNHVSFLDPIILYPYLPKNVYFVINTDIAKKIWFIVPFIKCITVDPLNPYSLKKVILFVKEGNTLLIFPEGRITTSGNLMKIYNGIALIAAKTKARIYPIILSGPEYSKFSRIKEKVNSCFFPKINIHINPAVSLGSESTENFRKRKLEISNNILNILQEAKYNGMQAQTKSFNLFDRLLEASVIHGNKKQFAQDITNSVSYKKAIISAYALGNKLEKILSNEDRVGIILPNSIAHLVTLFSLFYKGKTVAILNFTAGVTNNLECCETSDIKTIITARAFEEKGKFEDYFAQLSKKHRIVYLEDVKKDISIFDKIAALVSYLLKKPAEINEKSSIILYTSGSESKPKGVVLSHKNILSNVYQMACVMDFTHKDNMLNALPMFHSFGLTAGTLLPVLNGIGLYLYPTPLHYKIIPELAYDKNSTFILGTPTFLKGYAKNAHPYDFNSIRYVMAGGEKLKEDVRQIWLQKFGIRIFEGYGTTETSPVLSVNTPLFYRSGSVGRFLPGIQWKVETIDGIENGGKLLVKGDNVMEGYLLYEKGFVKAPEWYDCGDIVNVDNDGFITILARLKRFAKISGEMVSLDSIESIASKCFGSDKFASVCVSDHKKGEKIILCTTLATADKRTLREYIIQNGYSTLVIPNEIILMEKLPLLGNGKIDYITLTSIIRKEEK